MKKFLFLTLVLGFLNIAQAIPYDFSNSQDQESNDGTSKVTLWQVLDKLKPIKLSDHSVLLFKHQNIFRRSTNSNKFLPGTTFWAYDQGNNPILSESPFITPWNPTTYTVFSTQADDDLFTLIPLSLSPPLLNKELTIITHDLNTPKAKNYLKVGSTTDQEVFTDPLLAAYKKNRWRLAKSQFTDPNLYPQCH